MSDTDVSNSLRELVADLLYDNQVLRDRVAGQDATLSAIRACTAGFSRSGCTCCAERILNQTKLILNLCRVSMVRRDY